MPSSEAILHFIWKYKLFSLLGLYTVDGEQIQILQSGIHNMDSGPDFFNGKVKIGETLWAGNIEIHLKSSDWLKHKHNTDKAYDNVILHVVWDHDAPIYRTDKTLIPVLELKDVVQTSVLENYELLIANNYWIPCEAQLPFVDDFTKSQCLDRMLIERLEDKASAIKSIYQTTNSSWEDTFYTVLARSFGFKVNALPFELLAKNLPQLILAKHKNSAFQIEALIFGVAGFLDFNFEDEYPKELKNEFQFLRAKYQLSVLDVSLWKFSKTRPDNFPTIRLAQFAGLILQSEHLFSKIINIQNKKGFGTLFISLPTNNYWETHFRFDKNVENKSVNMGLSSIDNLLINAIAPLLFFYGKETGTKRLVDLALNLLLEIKPEENQIVRGFRQSGVKAGNAFDTQALIHLKKSYCDLKKCLNCGIGLKIIKKQQDD
ncbi:DUF2851 family protein [Pedobacter arcticus]|uniref:DUF2851 family protein n=1 Tax=Pedobacter arcticus TaxID=752140 RepID=UPI00030FDD0A|nr:DUF2851 family protein [Pedobacter arcticus]